MIKQETREQVKLLVNQYPEGISLNQLHSKFYRTLTRLQLRTFLSALYNREEISRERINTLNHRETRYYPFNGKPPVKRAQQKASENNGTMLSMKDFMPGKKYQAYIPF